MQTFKSQFQAKEISKILIVVNRDYKINVNYAKKIIK
jgi:hypothetical protein